jgi:hypothetical protein
LVASDFTSHSVSKGVTYLQYHGRFADSSAADHYNLVFSEKLWDHIGSVLKRCNLADEAPCGIA